MKIKSRFWLESDSGQKFFDNEHLKILESIDRLGSMRAAAQELKMNGRSLARSIKTAEENLGLALIENSSRGSGGKGSSLTSAAKTFLANFEKLENETPQYGEAALGLNFQGLKNMIVPAVAVVGLDGSGKSALIKTLVKAWTERGRRIGVIKAQDAVKKKSAHDKELLEAGAVSVITHNYNTLDISIDGDDLQPDIIAANYLPGTDLALIQSDKRLNLPSIDVFRQDLRKSLLTRKRKNILAVTGDEPPAGKNLPYYQIDDIEGLIELIENEVIKKTREALSLELVVDGRKVPLLPFVQSMIEQSVFGMVTALKFCENAGNINLIVRRF
ncbi:MAG: molybdopterin-guanine dinucleotide biosynthesis protein MobB [Deltaproteobacteria bacterium]|nr:molybdopterin-guanine dinucleotide biosynthesis protein MobB [Deltaproteobacteria bacterium]